GETALYSLPKVGAFGLHPRGWWRQIHKPISPPTSIHPPQGRAEHRKRSPGSGTPVPARKSGAPCASPRATPRVVMASNSRARPQRGPRLNGPPPAAELAKAGELFKEGCPPTAARDSWRRRAHAPHGTV